MEGLWLGLVGRALSRASRRALGRAGRPQQQQPNGWRALAAAADPPTVTGAGCTFENDLRATSGLGSGDGLTTHTDKWLSGGKGPMEMIAEVPPLEVHGDVVECYGCDHPGLGHPVEYIKTLGTSLENPAVCKYCGRRFYCAPH